MIMGEQLQSPHFEPRWPVGVTIVMVVALLTQLPNSLRLVPVWVAYMVGAVVFLPVAAVGLTAARAWWLRAERAVILGFCVYMSAAIIINLASLFHAMVYRSAEINGLQLLAASIAVWVNNVLMFSLLYWQLDRGGPEARVAGSAARPDYLFPQEGAPAEDVPPDWRPAYIDYLFLSYTTATAFSPTDTLPLTSRAKLLLMAESAISLVTILMVAARAINILG